MIHILGEESSVFNVFLAELRNEHIQKDRLRFRRNLERVGEIFAYEMSKTFDYSPAEIQTPLGIAQTALSRDIPVICTILRAGLPLQQGLLNYFDHADAAFVSAYRNHKKGSDQFEIQIEYLSCPSLDDRILILCDTMLATGASMVKVARALKNLGKPKQIHVVSVIASAEGMKFTTQQLPASTHYWIGALDQELTAQAYIVPGLGDAGDLAFGNKE